MMEINTTTSFVTGALLLAAAGTVQAQDYSIGWYTIDSGGVMHSESGGGQWQLAGTIGQWDATEARASSGGGWVLTGGFWSLTLEELADLLFRDRFETEDS